MIIFHILLLVIIDVSENALKYNSLFNIYRIRMLLNNRTDRNRIVLINFFGQPGIQILHVNKDYTDVKIPRRLNDSFRHLKIFKDTAKIEIINKEYYYGTNDLRINEDEERKLKYILESDDGDINDSQEAANYITAPFRDYLNYNAIIVYLKHIQRLSATMDLIKIGTTIKNRTIYGVLIKSGIVDSSSIFIEGGTIAREWMSISMALYVIKEMATNISAYPNIKNLNWIIVPVVNPDGYEYSHRNPIFRLWEKNRNYLKKCKHGVSGVNIDRNFPHYHGGIGSSFSSCSHLYLGPAALSEAESRSMQYIMLANRQSIKLYIGLRSFGASILYPWGLAAEPIFDEDELIRVGQVAANAMYETHKGKLENYTVGNYAKIRYPAAGNIMDFARGVMNIKYSYVIYLRGDGIGEKGFRPESTAIFPIIHECFQGILSLAEYADSRYPPPKSSLRLKANKRKRDVNYANYNVINSVLFFILFLFRYVT